MTVVPDMHHHHPTLGSRMAGNFFSSFHSKRNSPECCDTSTQFTFVSFIKRWASPSFHSYSPVKPACCKTQLWHSASASPKALTEYVAVGESADTLFSRTQDNTLVSGLTSMCPLWWGEGFWDLTFSLSSSPAVVGDLASKMLGFNLTTKQTSQEGVKVKTVSQTVDWWQESLLIFTR